MAGKQGEKLKEVQKIAKQLKTEDKNLSHRQAVSKAWKQIKKKDE